jgi:hypothetical protein
MALAEGVRYGPAARVSGEQLELIGLAGVASSLRAGALSLKRLVR